ncbi:uncharacterized protein LOC129308530 [Prosopis cineraria]|uniref:uncharacterized protein LOC129308530 n=1 Tax=Prosopis cineraria TaxID=364024 RepID=UPI00240F03A7|nr:uncharacterized protein LOC129308530 [Prosopis cineraria]
MKKMKGAVRLEPPYASYEDQRARLRHQSLLQDYEELLMETHDTRRKLEIMKQKKLLLLAEVGFLRRRYQYLVQNPLPKAQPKQDISKLQKVKTHAPTGLKGRSHSKKDLALRPPVPPYSNPKERIPNGVEVTLQKLAPVFDLNQNARTSSGKAVPFHGSASNPMLDLNQKDRIHSGKEATKKSIIPFFDLNQISREEEEMQGSVEPMKIEEPKKNTLRMLSDEQHNDIKLSVCRNVGDGSNRAGKRKITWQDQVALRV